MDRRDIVTAFLRHRGEVLLCRRSDEAESYPGRWGAVAGHAADDPDEAVRREIREKTGLDTDAITFVRSGDPFTVRDDSLGVAWRVHPFLFDCPTRQIEPNWETDEYEWTSPTEILRRETVPELWRSYDCVRPTAETVAGDSDHGSASLSVRTLEVLRDEAALAATGETDASWPDLLELARRLRDSRPTMAVVSNRIDRTVTDALDGAADAETLETSAREGIERATRVDVAAARQAVELLDGRVGTLSRSGTVRSAIEEANPSSLVVAESRPGGEGVDVATELATEMDVTLTSDAAFPGKILRGDIDVLVVGADTVLPDGRVYNKVGTTGAASACASAGVPVYVVTASDKIRPVERVHTAERDPAELYVGDVPLSVSNPTFEVVPSELADGIVTESGVLDTDEVRERARRHEKLAAWSQ